MPVISTNTAANSAVYYLNVNSNQESQALSELSSGSRIVNASDDAAGLAISTRIESDVSVLEQAATNSSHAVSVLQTADGGASNISDILTQMKSLASEAASGTESDSDRAYINDEFQQLSQEIDSIASGTRYNDESLLDGTSSFASGVTVMVGSSASDTITVTLSNLSASSLGVSSLDVSSQADANTALTQLDSAIDTVSAARAEIGAQESRFNFSSNDVQTNEQNLESANSAITDVDVASEESVLSSAEVKTQAAVAAAAQANKMPQYLLNLLES
ncbi:MAG TPA: flagellin [Bradyrhizobium sp.]|nr:flagellin [Bradyrhizobium sp.]